MTTKNSVIYKFRVLLEKLLPNDLFYFVRHIYRKSYFTFEFILRILNYIVFYFPNIYLKNKNIYLFCLKNLGIGDGLVITRVLNHYSKKGKVVLINCRGEAFQNLDIHRKILKDNFLNKFLILFMTNSLHSNIMGTYGDCLSFSKNSPKKLRLREQLFFKRKDILKEIENIPSEPIVSFSEEEIVEYSQKYSQLISSDYAIITPGSYLNGKPTIKNINKEKIQKVINNVNIKWVQVGTKDEPLLEFVVDLRGIKLRETFFIVSKAKFVVTVEGMLTHLAGAFDLPCVTIYTGFHDPYISQYKKTIPIQPNPLPECAYCWNHICKKTNNSEALCSKDIKSELIEKEVKKILNL